ncbi:hypothetical protein [Pseudoflavonifractor hominis]|uniref:Phage protein n=1 Tax=Pseudoflavonifractor hominis TaxID=2763059 RepID=A0ABR7HUD5_9FIRM|nr:hypothetical protein [Pseudoflavonifractor hominis]MBC5731119.1 hypothetical protein [Pseudoflavonifractor hominis]
MAKYQQYESVVLKDGQIVTIVEVYEPNGYDADVGHSPKDWSMVCGITDADIVRKATREELEQEYQESMRQLKEQGILK